jgi:hypothetical protein
MVNAMVGLSGLEAASTGVGRPGYNNYPPNFPNQYDIMNTVSIQRLAVDWGSFDLPSCAVGHPRDWARANAWCVRPSFGLVLVLTLPKGLTDSDTVASSPIDAPWGGADIPYTLPVAESQGVSVGRSDT